MQLVHSELAVENASAILLRARKYSETSLIVSWSTMEFGIIHTMARGARSPRSPFAGKLDLFFSAEIGFSRSRRSDLHNLREVEVTAHRRAIQRDYTTLCAAAYFVHLVELVVERETPIPELHELLTRAMSHLEGADPTRKLVERFEKRVVQYLGIERSDQAPHELVRSMFHGLPGSRRQLLEQLSETGKAPPDGLK
jgi:DNA repair protein RecO (recombination protein O)